MTTGATMTNWKNVNNWHWVDKNCAQWAKEYFKQKLEPVKAEKKGVMVGISSLSDMNGDVDLNQRKGKIITIFDVALTLLWKGEHDGIQASGKITIPEFMHDTELDDIVFDITLDQENREKEAIKAVVREALVPALREQFGTFIKDLIEAHKGDVYVEPEKMTVPATVYQPKPPAPEIQAKKSDSQVVGGVATIQQTIEFVASASDLYTTLLQQERVQHWTRSRAQSEACVGGRFSLFDGNITGSFIELVPSKKIVQQWRLKSWPKDHYSQVVMEFQDGRDNCVLKLTQKQVPIGEKDNTQANWHQYYWNPIKSAFGFGAIL